MPHTFTVQISDADWKALCYVTENPSKYCDDNVTEYISLMKNDVIKSIIRSELEKPGIREIPADVETLLSQAELKPAKQTMAESAIRMERMVANPDDVEDEPESIFLP